MNAYLELGVIFAILFALGPCYKHTITALEGLDEKARMIPNQTISDWCQLFVALGSVFAHMGLIGAMILIALIIPALVA